jgi:hypothetical protein
MSAVHATFSPLLQQTVAVFRAAGALGQGIHVTLRPNMTSVKSVSLVTRIKTQASLSHTFYTDVNGLYLIERTHDKSMPIEANYYPVGSAAVIQNRFTRVTLLSGQPMGAASVIPDSLEAMVDRTVENDDGKGLSYGEASDSPPSELQYTLLFEPRNAPEREERSMAYHSLIAQQALEQLFHPPTVFLASATAGACVWRMRFILDSIFRPVAVFVSGAGAALRCRTAERAAAERRLPAASSAPTDLRLRGQR